MVLLSLLLLRKKLLQKSNFKDKKIRAPVSMNELNGSSFV